MAKASKTKSDFAIERSHQASNTAYDLCRVTAQASMLINGGAATAVVALISKEDVDPALYQAIPTALIFFAAGVVASAAMMFCVMMMADYWNYFWYYVSYDKNTKYAEESETVANRWHRGVYVLFGVSMICFGSASWTLVRALSSISM